MGSPPDCQFCRIAGGEVDAHLVFEDEHSLAFLDNRPLFPGHSLLIPRAHRETLWDLPAGLIEPFFANVQVLSAAVREAMDAEGAFVAINNIVSQSVPHLHVHIAPRNRKDGLRGFFWPRTRYESETEAAAAAQAVREAVTRLS